MTIIGTENQHQYLSLLEVNLKMRKWVLNPVSFLGAEVQKYGEK